MASRGLLAVIGFLTANLATATATGGPPIASVQAIALDPTHPGTIYAGVYSGAVPGGVYKSTDYGATWTLLNADTNFSVDVRAVALDPVTPTNIYAGTIYTGVLKSTDGGATWNSMNTGLGSLPSVESLILDPSNPSTLYTCITGGIFKSTDGGASWTASNSGLSSTDVLGVTLQPGNPAVLYARVNDGGLYKSTNAGASWTAMKGLTSQFVYSLAIDPTNPTTLYAGTYNSGIFKSSDGAATWTAINSGLTDLSMGTALAIDPSNSNIVYTASLSGIWKSIDGGANWTAANVGLIAAGKFGTGAFNVLVVDPSNSNVYLGGLLGGFYKSVDGAGTWSAFDNGLSTSPIVLGLAVARANPAEVYAGTLWGGNSVLGGIFESPNGGAGWNALSFGLNQIQSLAIDPTYPTNIYAGPTVGMVGFLSGGGVLKSIDGGVTWDTANTGLPTISGFANGSTTSTTAGIYALAIDPSNTTTLYCAPGTGIYKSTDAGGNWAAAGTGLSASDTVAAIAVDPANPANIYAGTKTGALYKSADGASTWKVQTTNLPNAAIGALAVNPASPSTLYAGINSGTTPGAIYVSVDGGATWTMSISTLPGVLSLAVDPAVSTTLYGGTNSGGVFKSVDGGATWQAAGNNTGNGSTPAAAISKVSGDAQSAPAGQVLAIPLTVAVTNSSNIPVAGVTVSFSAGGGGSVPATSVVTDSQGVAATTLILGLAPGPNTVTASAAGLGQVVFSATGTSASSMAITRVGNSASFTQSFAPGMLMTVFGTGFSSGAPQIVSTVPLPPVAAGGSTVTLNGIAAPLLYVSATQINFQIPYELSPGSALLVVKSGGQSASLNFTIGAAGPGIFVDYRNGNLLPNESAATGSTIGFYVTGAGLVTPAVATANVPAAGATPVPNLPVTVTIGGVTVTPVYIGIPSWSVGVLQINVTVPAFLPAGVQPVVVTVGGVPSVTALLNVTQ